MLETPASVTFSTMIAKLQPREQSLRGLMGRARHGALSRGERAGTVSFNLARFIT